MFIPIWKYPCIDISPQVGELKEFRAENRSFAPNCHSSFRGQFTRLSQRRSKREIALNAQ